MGIKNESVTNEDSCVLASHFPAFFNAIQGDAPCSGGGMLRKLPEAIPDKNQAREKECGD